jgi:predicted GNAT superfamily acetyltransferase
MKAEVSELSDIDDLRRLASLFAAVWGRSVDDPPISTDILKALVHSGNYVAGGFVDRRLIGGLVGWLGGTPPRDLHMHSHILGVLPGSDAQGVGFDLKQHQRRWCLARDVRVMEWTTDPLVRRNAYFNLTKLGAEASAYLADFYGEMRDGINAGDQSDRLLIRWRLDGEKAQAAAAGVLPEPDVDKLREWGSSAILSIGPRGEPVAKRSEARVLICQMPEDIVAMRSSKPELAHQWRMAVRLALGEKLEHRYEITGATRSGWYVLEKQ